MDTANHWVLTLPSFENGFTFNPEVAQLLLTLILLAAGLALTYLGLRAVKTALLMAAAALCGWGGVLLVNYLTSANALLEMVFFITMAFFGVCGFYFLSVLWNGLLSALHIRVNLSRYLWPVSAVLGGGLLGGVIWLRIYRYLPAALALAMVFAGTGLWVQYRHSHRRRTFHTYEEIYRMNQKEGLPHAGCESKGTEIPS